ncbi:MAG TPA: hypothetical protein VIL07_05740 [Symbiobacteriaceae bacterium]
MISYRATLPAPPAAVVAVWVRPVRQPRWHLGGDLPSQAFRVTIRYALHDGRVRAHRGLVWVAVSPDRPLRVVAWQVDGSAVAVALMASSRSRERRGCQCFADRFVLPVVWQAPGVQALEAADVHVKAAASGRGDALLVRGVVSIRLQGQGVEVPVRIPFGRLLAFSEAGELRWRVRGGVAGMHLAVGPDGEIRGEVALKVVYQGTPAAVEPSGEVGGILQVREMTATVAAAKAEPAGSDLVLVQGMVEVDIYWVDSNHRSRWTGKAVPFGGIARLPGIQEGDRLEVQAEVQRIREKPRCAPGTAILLLKATVTHLRLTEVNLGEGCYRLERVLGQVSLPIEVTVQWAEPAWLTGDLPEEDWTVPELGLPGPWRELSMEAGARTGSGDRWQLQAGLKGEVVGGDAGAGGWRRTGAREGSLPPGFGACAAVLPSLQRLGPEGLSGRMAVVPAPTALRQQAPRRVHVGHLDVPGAVRWILGIWGEGGRSSRVQVLVADEHGLRLVEGPILKHGKVDRPAALTVYPGEGKTRGLVVVGEY